MIDSSAKNILSGYAYYLAEHNILDKEAACVLEVVQGKADAFIYDQLSVYTNWQKKLIGGTARYNTFQASLSGGGGNTNYLLGSSYRKESTVFPGDYSDQKASVLFNLNHSSDEQRFHLSFSANYVYDNNNLL